MQKCILLAKQGLGYVAPNPMVGCVIVYDNKVIGEGYHQQYGQAHAEVNAIESVKDKSLLTKSKLYVTLEPCTHYGKTPPCADLLLQYKIPYVVVGCLDVNPLVKGKGIKKLIEAGCDVKVGILEKECINLNKRFFTFHEKKRPYIILKWAQSADGFISSTIQSSKFKIQDSTLQVQNPTSLNSIETLNETTRNLPEWISNSESRKLVHQWRAEEQAIMVGTTTALLDNPQLTVRGEKGKNPIRIVLDKDLKIPNSYHLYNQQAITYFFTQQEKKSDEWNKFVLTDFSKPILPQLLQTFYKNNIQSVIIEGGSILLQTFIDNNLWDEARVFVSEKKLENGTKAPNWKTDLKEIKKERIETDYLLTFSNYH